MLGYLLSYFVHLCYVFKENAISGPVTFKPGISIRSHFFLAATIWSLAGISLMIRGLLFLQQGTEYMLLVAALVLGTMKGFFVLQRSAARNISRIRSFQERTCFGAVFSIKAWLLVLVMILLGRWLRLSGCPPGYIGLLYTAVGWALLFSSRILWQEWRKSP